MGKAVKKSVKEDKRKLIDWKAAQAEEAMRRGNFVLLKY